GEKGVGRPVDPIEDDAVAAAQHGLPVARTPTRGDAWAGIVPGRAINALRRAFAHGQPGQRRVPDLSLFGGRPALRENILRAERLARDLIDENRLAAPIAAWRCLDAVIHSQRDGERRPDAPDVIEIHLV